MQFEFHRGDVNWSHLLIKTQGKIGPCKEKKLHWEVSLEKKGRDVFLPWRGLWLHKELNSLGGGEGDGEL